MLLWGGAVGGTGPFIWTFPVAPKPSARLFPFGIASELTGPENKEGRECPKECDNWLQEPLVNCTAKGQCSTQQTGWATILSVNSLYVTGSWCHSSSTGLVK